MRSVSSSVDVEVHLIKSYNFLLYSLKLWNVLLEDEFDYYENWKIRVKEGLKKEELN